MFIKQPHCLGIQAVAQSASSGLDGPAFSTQWQQMKQVMCWVTQVVVHSPQTVAGVNRGNLREADTNDSTRWFHHSLESLLFSLSAAGEPH